MKNELYKRVDEKMAILKDLVEGIEVENMTHDDQVMYNQFIKAIDKYSTHISGRLTKAQWLEGMRNNTTKPYGTTKYGPDHVYKYDHESGKYMHRHTSWRSYEWNDCDMDDMPEDRDFLFTDDIGGRASREFMARCAQLGI